MPISSFKLGSRFTSVLRLCASSFLFCFALSQATAAPSDICTVDTNFADLSGFACDLTQISSECRDWFAQNPETLQYAKDCTKRGDPAPSWPQTCADAGIDAWTSIWKSLATAGVAIDACEADADCKFSLAQSAYFVCRDSAGKNLYPCTDPRQLAEVTVGDLLRKREQVVLMANRDAAYRKQLMQEGVPLPTGDEAPLDLLTAGATKALKDLGIKAQCYNPAGYARMACYAIATVADPTIIAGGMAIKGLRGARWASAVLKTVPEEMSPAFLRTTKLVQKSEKIQFFEMNGPIKNHQITPGQTYTASIHNGQLYLGKDIRGPAKFSRTKGTHIVLNKIIGKKDIYDYDGRGGAVRFNPDGSIDISGYHLGGSSSTAAERIADFFRRQNPDVRIRITPDRLSTLPAPE